MTDKKNDMAELIVTLLELVATNYENKIVQLTKERDEARKTAEYWHRRFFMTDGYDSYDPKTNGWLPIKWSTDGKSVYTEPPVQDEDEDCDVDDIVAAAERLYERENDTPTEPRSDLD